MRFEDLSAFLFLFFSFVSFSRCSDESQGMDYIVSGDRNDRDDKDKGDGERFLVAERQEEKFCDNFPTSLVFSRSG